MKSFEFASSSSPGTVYTTVWADDGRLLCACKGWNLARSPLRDCTHTKQVAARFDADGFTTEVRGQFVYLVNQSGAGHPDRDPSTDATRAVEAIAARLTRRDVIQCPRCRSAVTTVGPCEVCGFDIGGEPEAT